MKLVSVETPEKSVCKMTFSATAITDVVVDASNETESIGGVAAPTLQEALAAAFLTALVVTVAPEMLSISVL